MEKTFAYISENQAGDGFEIMRGTYAECVKSASKDEWPSYVVQVSVDEDGDEVMADELSFVNKAWNDRYAR